MPRKNFLEVDKRQSSPFCRNASRDSTSVAKKLRAAVVKCAKVRERNTRLLTFVATQIFALAQIQEKPSTKV